jgi:hypothetical protein
MEQSAVIGGESSGAAGSLISHWQPSLHVPGGIRDHCRRCRLLYLDIARRAAPCAQAMPNPISWSRNCLPAKTDTTCGLSISLRTSVT